MSVRQDKRGCYLVEFRFRGDRVFRRLPKGATREQAQELETRLRTACFDQITLGKPPQVSLPAAVQMWLNEVVEGRKAAGSTRSKALLLAEAIRDKTISDIPDVAATYTREHRKKLAPATINRRLCVLKAVAKFAYRREWIGENLSAKVPLLPEDNAREIYLSRQQVRTLAVACRHAEARAMIIIGAYTGMRAGEIMRLVPGNIHGDVIRLSSKTKTGKPRTIPILPQVEKALRVLPFRTGYRSLYSHFEAARAKAGLDGITFHDLRHTTASLLIAAGVDLYTVGVILGHKSVQTTKRYAHLPDANLKREMRKIA